MFINAPALKRQENSFKIIHNKTEYSVDPIKMAENSKFFAEKLLMSKDNKFEINDMHSETAFDTFIKMCNYQDANFNFEDNIELQSIIDEWKCDKIRTHLSHIIVDNPHFYAKEDPFVERPHDQSKEQISMKKVEKPPEPQPKTPETPKKKVESASITPIQFKLPNTKNIEKALPATPNAKVDQPPVSQSIKLHIKTRTGNLYSISINLSDTVEKLKRNLVQRTGIPINQQLLYFKSDILKNDSTISSLKLENRSRVYLERLDETLKGDEITIIVQHQSCSDVPYYISGSRKVDDLLTQIRFKESRNPPFDVMFNGKVLNPQNTISSYGITDHSSVLLVFRK